jgi:hypothetical protein
MQREVDAKMPPQDSNKKTPKTAKIKLPKLDYGNIGVTGEVIELRNFTHMPGYNCQLSSLRKTLAYYHWEYSEEMLLGLASALGMLYWEMKFMPTPFIGALNAKELELFERNITRLGGQLVPHLHSRESR